MESENRLVGSARRRPSRLAHFERIRHVASALGSALALGALLALTSCSFQLGPMSLALGNGGGCRGVWSEVTLEEPGKTVYRGNCNGLYNYGGPISESGAGLVRGVANTARKAAGALVGAPVP